MSEMTRLKMYRSQKINKKKYADYWLMCSFLRIRDIFSLAGISILRQWLLATKFWYCGVQILKNVCTTGPNLTTACLLESAMLYGVCLSMSDGCRVWCEMSVICFLVKCESVKFVNAILKNWWHQAIHKYI